jgi:hypothetical protein
LQHNFALSCHNRQHWFSCIPVPECLFSSYNFFRGEATVEVFEIGEDGTYSSFAYGHD